jgi:DMSO/TMAO reductase YedYZ molybdopterin-dependent catalytic subunit
MNLSRRELLRTAPVALAGAGGMHPLFTARAAADPMIVRQREPRNLETPLADLFSADNEKFYVRNHFPMPALDAKAHKVAVEGHVENKLELSLDELKKMGAASREVVLECAGNGRVFLVPPAKGTQWSHGGVGQAKWTGVPLGAILERAKLKTGAAEVVLVGADGGAPADAPGPIHYDRSVPLAKAKADETLIVWEMNGRPLPAEHGGPLRAIVGGWYGMASVKWLSRIIVLDRPHNGFFQTLDYAYWTRDREGLPHLTPLTAIQPKAVVVSPAPGEELKAGQEVSVKGFAWAGENAAAKVEISTDGGKTWSAANLGKSEPLKAASWTAKFTPKAAGPLKLVARCTDDKGNAQPEKRDPDRRNYMINHLVPVELTVK